jgi:hypothetical protein
MLSLGISYFLCLYTRLVRLLLCTYTILEGSH